MPKNKLSAIEVERFKEIMANPVMWARAFIRTFNPKTKKHEPWVARWYQAEILLDESVKKVARCGRRTGKHLLFICELLEGPTPWKNQQPCPIEIGRVQRLRAQMF